MDSIEGWSSITGWGVPEVRVTVITDRGGEEKDEAEEGRVEGTPEEVGDTKRIGE